MQRWEISFLQGSKKKVIMTFSFDKKNLSEDPFTLEMEIHWDKSKGGGIKDYHREHT